MPTADDSWMEMYRMMNEAMHDDRESAEINAGELHRRVGEYPARNHRMPVSAK